MDNNKNEHEPILPYHVLILDGDKLIHNAIFWDTKSQLAANFPPPNCAIVLESELPDNWQDMTIVNGRLVEATADVIATRRQVRMDVKIELIRTSRKMRYENETDILMIDAIEEFARAHPEYSVFKQWLDAKAKIREDLPKPDLGEGE